MNKVKIEIFQGVIIPLKIDPKEASDLLSELISDLSKIKVEFPLDSGLKSVVKVKPLYNLEGDRRSRWRIYTKHMRKEIYLRFSTTISFADQNFPEYVSSDYSSNDFYIEHILIPEFEKRYYDFLITLDVCRVGALHTGIGLIYSNGRFIKPIEHINLYPMEVLSYSLDKKWPVFESLDILKTWDWYLTKTSPKGVDELSSSPLSRAINALSYLYDKNAGGVENLFWSMVGIEALYVKGKEAISEQVRKKAQIFLGEIKEFKKRLTIMYDYRSAFVHGSKNFPSFFHINDALDSYDKYMDEYSKALLSAKSLLLATLQRMAKYNMCELEFEYNLKKGN